MEKHLFKFGDSSLAMIIPKKWSDKHGLKPSSKVNVHEGAKGELIIGQGKSNSREVERAISPVLSPKILARWVGLHYMLGTAKLKLHFKNKITDEQLQAIENMLRADCLGFEITAQSSNVLQIEDFTNPTDIDFEKVLVRIKSLIESEFKEVIEGNYSGIEAIEGRVNRFYTLAVRYINIIQPNDSPRYLSMLDKLELISDNINNYLQLRSKLDYLYVKATPAKKDGATETKLSKEVLEVFKMLQEQFMLCFDGFNGDDAAIERSAELRARIMKRSSELKIDKVNRYFINEITNEISNIAEYGLGTESEQDVLLPPST